MGGRVRQLFHVKLLAITLVFLSVATAAWAQSEEEVTAAAGKQLDAYTQCIKVKAAELAKSKTWSAEIVAENAINNCPDERHALWEQLQKPPLSFAPDQAAREITSAEGQLKPLVIETVKDARS